MTFEKYPRRTFDGAVSTAFGRESASRILISYLREGGILPTNKFDGNAQKFIEYLNALEIHEDVHNNVFEFAFNGKLEFEYTAKSVLLKQ